MRPTFGGTCMPDTGRRPPLNFIPIFTFQFHVDFTLILDSNFMLISGLILTAHAPPLFNRHPPLLSASAALSEPRRARSVSTRAQHHPHGVPFNAIARAFPTTPCLRSLQAEPGTRGLDHVTCSSSIHQENVDLLKRCGLLWLLGAEAPVQH